MSAPQLLLAGLQGGAVLLLDPLPLMTCPDAPQRRYRLRFGDVLQGGVRGVPGRFLRALSGILLGLGLLLGRSLTGCTLLRRSRLRVLRPSTLLLGDRLACAQPDLCAAEDVLDKLCGLERLRRRADQVHQRGLLVRAWVNSECGLDVSLGLLGTVSGDDQPGVLEPLASLQRDAEVALCHALPPFPFGCPDGATVPYITPCANCQASVSGIP